MRKIDKVEIVGGRQLLVDDYLIRRTNLKRVFHAPQWHHAGPVLTPEVGAELGDGICPMAMPFQDGVFFDAAAGHFKMYYEAGWLGGTALATSVDGIDWQRPVLDVVPGTNLVVPPRYPMIRDGGGVWIDHETTKLDERYKMFIYYREVDDINTRYADPGPMGIRRASGYVYTSPDGVHWIERGQTGPCGDNTNFFYNPFRKTWFYSVRLRSEGKRARSYREARDFVADRNWSNEDLVLFAEADSLDEPDAVVGDLPEIYNFDAVGYESLMLGVFAVHRGPSNEECFERGVPKLTDLELGYSRDGVKWSRPDRRGFLNCSRRLGDWNRGYLHASGGVCAVVGDELYFYVGAFSGVSPKLGRHMYAGGATGLARLRRDGFASMSGSGTLDTKLINCDQPYIFLNCNSERGLIRLALLDEMGNEIPGYGLADCDPILDNRVTRQVTWNGKGSVADLVGHTLSLRFELERSELFAFWFSPSARGESLGYVGAGGPAFSAARDV